MWRKRQADLALADARVRNVDFDAAGLTVRYSQTAERFHLPIDELALVSVGVDPDEPRRRRRTFWFFDRRGRYTSAAGANAKDLLAWVGHLPGFDPALIPAEDAPEQLSDVWRRAELRCPRCEEHLLVDATLDPAIATGRFLRPLFACACGYIVQIGFARMRVGAPARDAAVIDWTEIDSASVAPRSSITPEHLGSFDGFFVLRSRSGQRRIVWADAIDIVAFVDELAARLGCSPAMIIEKMLVPADETELGTLRP